MRTSPFSRRVCMIVYAYYPDDPRVRREAEALVGDGWAVDVVCLRDRGQSAHGMCCGVTVYRLLGRRRRGGGPASYLLEYGLFTLLATLYIGWLHLRRRYTVVQAHAMPDALVFAAVLPRLMGARVVLDLHDLVPEVYLARFGGSWAHPAIRLLCLIERASVGFADHVIAATEPLRDRVIARGAPPAKVTTVMNSADPQLFPRLAPPVRDGARPFTLVYHGGLYERIGLDTAIRAVGRLQAAIPDLRLEIYGDGEAAAGLAALAAQLGLAERVHFHGRVPLDAIPLLVAAADLGVVPWKHNAFTELAYPTKAFECIALGVPPVMARTPAVAQLFGTVPDLFFSPERDDELAALILALFCDDARRQRLAEAVYQAYIPFAWERQRQRYLAVMGGLAAQSHAASALRQQ